MNWWHWHTEPELIGGLLLVTWLYALFTGPLRFKLAPGTPYPLRSALFFYSGIVLFYLTVGSPLDFVGEVYLFSAHMAQHIFLMYPVPMLLILGLPDWLTRPILRHPVAGSCARFLTRPLVAGALFIIVLTGWHIPTFYEASLQNRWIHNFEHMTMFGVGFCAWWLIFSQSSVRPALNPGAQVLFIFLLSLGKIPVATYLVFSDEVLYPTYEFAARISGLSAMEDQVLGGTMKILMAKFAGVLVIAYSFYLWHREYEREEAARDAAEARASESPETPENPDPSESLVN